MEYKESLLLCENKQDFIKLCEVLNSAIPKLKGKIDIFAIGKLKQAIPIWNPYDEYDFDTYRSYKDCVFGFSEDMYFIWWRGENYPYQNGNWLKKYMIENFRDEYTKWHKLFCEDIYDRYYNLSFFYIDTKEKGTIQSTYGASVVLLPPESIIEEDYIVQLDEGILRYRESILTCYDNQDFIKLCAALNSAKQELKKWIDVYAIGKTKSKVFVRAFDIYDYIDSISEDTLFIWLKEYRYPPEHGLAILNEHLLNNIHNTAWTYTSEECIYDMDELSENIVRGCPGIFQKNKLVSIIEIPDDQIIEEDLISRLWEKV